MPTAAEVRAHLTGPGGMFEVVTEDIGGRPMQVYKNRMRSLREVAAMAKGRGDDQPFLVHGDRRYGFGEFVSLANSVSHTLAAKFDVAAGDRVAVLSQNNPQWVLAFWGAVDIGAVLVGLNGWWKSDEVLYGLQDSGAKVLVADGQRFERIAGHLDACPDLRHVFIIDGEPGDDPRLHGFDELTASPTADLPDVPIDEDDDAVILYTSGTTGRPKGAVNTHRNMIANLQNTLYNAIASTMLGANLLAGGDGGQTVSLLTSPLFHVSGLHSGVVVGLAGGVRIVIPEGKFDPVKALRLIERERVTIWATVPTMVWRVCEHPDRHDFDTSSVTAVAFGGSPSAEELQRKVRETFPNVRSTTNAYGLTESSSVATLISGEDAERKPDSVGPPVPTVEVRVVGPDGSVLPAGGTGEIQIRGPIIMDRYWNKPEATASVLEADGWLHTGDIGHVDDEGFVFITDRAKDMIIRGGENVYCVEIENRLVEHPKIADAAVIGVPHPELGEEVKAVVQVESGEELTAAEVREWVAAALANFKVPAHVDLVTEKLPRNASGKLLKNVLRGEGEVSFDETL